MTSRDGPGHLTTDELFRQHAGFVARFLSRLSVPSDQLEDALQEVFLVAHKNGGYKPGLAKPTSYLASIAIRAAARHRRRDGLARQRHSDAPLEHVAGEHDDPARTLQTRQDLARLQRALARLPEELCTTLLLVEMEGESCVSVAAGLGCPVGTIYWRLHAARKELRAALRVVDAQSAHDAAAQRLEERAQPARSWMILFGLEAFDRSEAARLLKLARAQPAQLPLDELLARHHTLIRAGELPAWASGLPAQPASWLSVLGAGPLAAAVAVGSAIVALSVLALQSEQEPARAPSTREPRPATVALVPAARPSALPSAQQDASLVASAAREPQPVAARAPRQDAQRSEPSRTTRASPAPASREPAPVLEVIAAALSETRSERASAAGAPEPEAVREPQAVREPAPPQAKTAADGKIGRAFTDLELAEMRAIARAERLLAGDPKRSLALTRAMAAGFPNGRFLEERAYLEVMALHNLGRRAEMRAKAQSFLGAYPAGLYSERVRKALADRGE